MPIKTFKLRPKADADLMDIYRHSLQEWGQNQAEQYIREIDQAFINIANNTALGRDCTDIRPSLRAFNVGSHVIFYKPMAYGVAVIRVLHKVMSHSKHL